MKIQGLFDMIENFEIFSEEFRNFECFGFSIERTTKTQQKKVLIKI